MKILYLDILSPIGHKDINKIFIRLLREFTPTDVSWRKGYIRDGSFLNTVKNFYPIPEIYYKFSSKMDYRVKNYNKIKWIIKNINVDSYDLIFISSYETISFALAWPKKTKSRVIILNHNNLDELKVLLKKFFFKRIPDYVEHIVFEEYMKKYIVEEIKVPNRIWVIHYPIDFCKVHDYQQLLIEELPKNSKNNEKIIFAPSGSNDENFILKLINTQKKEKFLNNTVFNLLIKSRQSEYRDDHLIVTKKYFAYKEYLMYLGNASLLLLPYPKDFRYRVSGVLFDAFAFKKSVIASSIPLFQYFVNKYPFIGKLFYDMNSFKESIYFYNRQIGSGRLQNDALFNKVINAYSIKSVKEAVQRMLGVQ